MNKEIEFLRDLVKKAYGLVDEKIKVEDKGENGDLVTNFDLKIELFIIDEIKKKYPNFDIISEEFNSQKKASQNYFVIDPIDGTINFANGIPLWGIQVACVKEGETCASVIYLPEQNELFWADENGAYLNNKKIHVTNYKNTKNILYSVEGSNTLSSYFKLRKYSSNRRNYGALCVSLAYVAKGRIHGAFFGPNKPWDYEPGLYIVKKAGGVIIDKDGAHIGACNEELAKILEKEASKITNPPNVFVLHSLSGDSVKYWGIDVKRELESRDLKVYMPEFPTNKDSSFDKFNGILTEYQKQGKLNERTIVICHSISCAYFIRFATLHNYVPFSFIAVAPAAIYPINIEHKGYIAEVIKKAYPVEEDLEYTKNNLKNKYCIYSDEDNKPQEYFDSVCNLIDAQKCYLSGYNHFDGKHRIYKIPELIEIVERIISE